MLPFQRRRDEDSEPFECPQPITCQFPRCDCDRIERPASCPVCGGDHPQFMDLGNGNVIDFPCEQASNAKNSDT